MKLFRHSFVFAPLLAASLAIAVFGQSSTFSDPNVEYSFGLPDAKWKMTSKPTSMSPNVEYVFVDRNDGHLEIRKLTVASDAMLSDVIRNEEQRTQFLQGYVAGKEENFRGNLSGMVFNFEFVKAARPMSGRYYFLRANPTTVYVIRFTGYRDKLRAIRNQTDSIARTFELRK